jgi:hypothetical protein
MRGSAALESFAKAAKPKSISQIASYLQNRECARIDAAIVARRGRGKSV